MPIDPSTAFVSYSREDLEFVLRLVKDLKAKGAKVWMDKLDLRPGQLWDTEVETAVDQCARMLVILSPAAVDSQKVKNEFMVALDEGKVVIPVFFRECRIPLQLRRLQYADFRSDYSVGMDELLASLSATPQATPDGAKAETEELGRVEEERKREKWVRAAEGAQGSSDYGGWLSAAEHAAALEEERKRQEEVEATRVAAESEARLAQIAEEAKLELEEHQRKQTQAEAQRLAAQPEAARKAEEEKARQAKLERQRQEQQKTQTLAPARDAAPPKYPVWIKGGIAVIVLLAVGLLVYWALSGSRPKEQTGETQRQEVKTEAPSPAPNTQIFSTEPQTPLPATEAKAIPAKPKTSAATTPSRPSSEQQSRALTPPKPARSEAIANAPQFTDPKLADVYRKAQAGDSSAMVNLGFAYYKGNGVGQDYQQAFTWYRKAAEAGDPVGMDGLGFMYRDGKGVTQDYGQAVTWFRKAADAGIAQGMDHLGRMYETGRGVTQDYAQSASWFRKAAEAGNANGMYNLGVTYEKGWGVEKDQQQAITWYRKAAQLGNEMAKERLKLLGQNP